MGYAVPAAIGAKLARPDGPPAIGLMTGLELLTAANQGAAVAVFVLRDRELAQIAQFQRKAFNRKAASVLPDYDVASLAEAVGIEWRRLDADSHVADLFHQRCGPDQPGTVAAQGSDPVYCAGGGAAAVVTALRQFGLGRRSSA